MDFCARVMGWMKTEGETMMDRSQSVRSLRWAAWVLVGVLGMSNPAAGAGAAGKILWEIGKKVTDLAVGYLAGKVIDRALGQDYEQQLKRVEANLLAEIRNNPGNGNGHVLRAELESARSQIRVLNAVLKSKPSTEEVAALRSKMASDLQEMRRVLEQQGVRLEKHEQRLNQHDVALEQHGKTLEELDRRIDRLEEESETAPPWREPAGEPSSREDAVPEWRSRISREGPSVEDREPSRRLPPGSRGEEGATLTILVRGDSCTIEIRETGRSSLADRGSFEVRKTGDRRLFHLLAGTGAVVTILGDNNRVRVPAGVGRIRIRNLGKNNYKSEP